MQDTMWRAADWSPLFQPLSFNHIWRLFNLCTDANHCESAVSPVYSTLHHVVKPLACHYTCRRGCSQCRGFTVTFRHSTLLWTSDQPDAETSTWKHTTFASYGHPCSRLDSNPRSQQASGLRPRCHWNLLGQQSVAIIVTVIVVIQMMNGYDWRFWQQWRFWSLTPCCLAYPYQRFGGTLPPSSELVSNVTSL